MIVRAPSASCILLFFFFQAEDGIRDYKVTGVQTCALPISTTCRWSELLLPLQRHVVVPFVRGRLGAGIDEAERGSRQVERLPPRRVRVVDDSGPILWARRCRGVVFLVGRDRDRVRHRVEHAPVASYSGGDDVPPVVVV